VTYSDSIAFLYGLQKFGMKFGLRGIRGLLRSLRNPEKQFPSVHIAGTNGKGSSASMIAAVFTAAGYKTALYTSPHLVDFSERIRIDGRPISSKDVARLTTMLRPAVERNRNTFFEVVTAIAFKYFAESRVDIAVVETGLGGRLDATNVLRPLVSVITTIGLEHTRILGRRLSDIAFEKGGIIKHGVPCITGVRQEKAARILSRISKEKHAELVRVSPGMFRLRRRSLEGSEADFDLPDLHLGGLAVSLAGEHQLCNALLGLFAITYAARRGRFLITEDAIRRGFGNIHRYSGLRARLSVIRRNPLVLADVAHNAEAARALSSSLRRMHFTKVDVVFGLMEDKNYRQVIGALHKIIRRAFIVQPRIERSRASAHYRFSFCCWRGACVVAGEKILDNQSIIDYHSYESLSKISISRFIPKVISQKVGFRSIPILKDYFLACNGILNRSKLFFCHNS
jgi:dihydrofolate synthase/folylpolyglutamate synthase